MATEEQLEAGTIEAFKAWRKDRSTLIEILSGGRWESCPCPEWTSTFYRIKPEPIPQGVSYHAGHDNFYDANGNGMGVAFYQKWLPRLAEFPKYEHKPKTIPLGPEDVIVGTSVFTHTSWTHSDKSVAVTVSKNGIVIFDDDVQVSCMAFDELKDDVEWRWSKHGDGNFVRCEKVVT